MWPVEALCFPLPDSFRPAEDPHFFELRCVRCSWTATFSATGVRPEEIVATALAHHCPEARSATKLCLHCRREIGELATTCPFCGADNPLLPE